MNTRALLTKNRFDDVSPGFAITKKACAMKRTLVTISAVWIVLIATSFVWNYLNAETEQKNVAFQTARSFFRQVLVDREWNALHGGVYVPVTKDTQPNPYLDADLSALGRKFGDVFFMLPVFACHRI